MAAIYKNNIKYTQNKEPVIECTKAEYDELNEKGELKEDVTYFVTDEENVSSPIVLIKYKDLRYLRDNAKLNPGTYYRITDYDLTTNEMFTRSAGHRFDIITQALSEYELDENCRACHHIGDEYFKYSAVEAWKIQYSIDNDWRRCHWCIADVTINGSKIKDSCSYFRRLAEKYITADKYTTSGIDSNSLEGYQVICEDGNIYVSSEAYGFRLLTITYTTSSGVTTAKCSISSSSEKPTVEVVYNTSGKGHIYHMVDEFNNEAPYDFKNLQYEMRYVTSVAADKTDINTLLNDTSRMSFIKSKVYPMAYTTHDLLNGSIRGATLTCEYADEHVWCYTFNDVTNNTDGVTYSDASVSTETASASLRNYNVAGFSLYGHIMPVFYTIFKPVGLKLTDIQYDRCHQSIRVFINNNSNTLINAELQYSIIYNSGNIDSDEYAYGSVNIFYETNRIKIGRAFNNNILTGCSFVSFETGVQSNILKEIWYSHFADGVKYATFGATTDGSTARYYDVKSEIQGSSSNILDCTIDANLSYTTTIAKNSSGTIQKYCAAD